MLSERLARACGGVILSARVDREGAGNGAPVIEDMRDVGDLIHRQSFSEPQDEVVVLAAVERAAPATEVTGQAGPEYRQVIDKVLRPE
ncbi:hypothetical protein D3C78_1105150 [compost metagenome]